VNAKYRHQATVNSIKQEKFSSLIDKNSIFGVVLRATQHNVIQIIHSSEMNKTISVNPLFQINFRSPKPPGSSE